MKQNAISTLIDKHILKVLRNNNHYLTKQRNGKYEAFMLYDPNKAPNIEKIVEICESDDINEAVQQFMHEAYDQVEDRLQNDLVNEVMESIGKQLKANIRKKLDKLVEWKYEKYELLSETYDMTIVLNMGNGYTFGGSSKDKAKVYGNNKSLIWLADQHGHMPEQLMYALTTQDKEKLEQPGAGFLASCRDEVDSIPTVLGDVTFLVEMKLGDILTIAGLIKEANEDEDGNDTDHGDIVLCAGVTTGLFDPWQGGYGNFRIEVDHDIVIPIKYISSALPDTGVRHLCSSLRAQGFSADYWRPALKAIRKPGEPKEENEF